MSFNFDSSSSINRFKAQSAYKDGSGMGGGGMYFQQQNKKRKDEPEDDIFESTNKEKTENELTDIVELKEEDIPRDTLFNKFVNWFRPDD